MKKFKNLFRILGYAIYFLLGSFVIFINFMTIPNISTSSSARLEIAVAILAALYFPGMICIQFHTIRNLENKIEELENERSDKNPDAHLSL
ncbi:hypothetical protein B5F07_14860 [Lachnoclostridium sp. An169]|uniref:hypothetical protein n=1 Tax=Lachnoclostridium sp. An169 TaxID=1965569 RepID=UPI000B368D0D|nr:hypothetical protein [Lachnoclostridium sp. An169]OUP82059.1 hypothetical protein B5F07_14860 [Lachnoclostridium sp. An169]